MPVVGRTVPLSLLIVISALYLFARLGHYALWDDETYTSLGAEGILRTGDTSAMLDHNIVAFRGGIMLRNLRDRFTPPLPSYLAAASITLLGHTAFAARLPFALCGFATILVIVYWLWRSRASPLRCYLIVIAVLGNVSFFLYCRQARYYAPVLLCCIVLGYLYLNFNGKRRQAFLFACILVCLFASNAIAFASVCVALASDYIFWARRTLKIEAQYLFWIAIPSAVAGIAVASVWNPFATQHGGVLFANSLFQRATLFWWNLRDLDRCEFGVGILLITAIFVYCYSKDRFLIRGVVAIAIIVFITSLVSPQTVSNTSVADVRYILPVIPLCIFTAVFTIERLIPNPVFSIPFALLAFHTNLLHPSVLSGSNPPQSTSRQFIAELINPPGDPYTPVAQWIREDVHDKESVWVVPDYMTYPLMFHAPKALYAWQLDWPPHGQFANMPEIYFKGRVPPDYVVVFGPVVQQVAPILKSWQPHGVRYEVCATIDCFWRDLYRPELFWRSFTPVRGYNPNLEAIYIFRRIKN